MEPDYSEDVSEEGRAYYSQVVENLVFSQFWDKSPPSSFRCGQTRESRAVLRDRPVVTGRCRRWLPMGHRMQNVPFVAILVLKGSQVDQVARGALDEDTIRLVSPSELDAHVIGNPGRNEFWPQYHFDGDRCRGGFQSRGVGCHRGHGVSFPVLPVSRRTRKANPDLCSTNCRWRKTPPGSPRHPGPRLRQSGQLEPLDDEHLHRRLGAVSEHNGAVFHVFSRRTIARQPLEGATEAVATPHDHFRPGPHGRVICPCRRVRWPCSPRCRVLGL